jgi:hypothetical protein
MRPTDLDALTKAMASGNVRRIADVLFPRDVVPYVDVEIIPAAPDAPLTPVVEVVIVQAKDGDQ